MKEHELWNELGNLYFLSGSYDRAIRAYNHAVDLNPGSGEPYANLALTYSQMGKYAEAADHYQQGIPLLIDELDRAVSLYKLGEVRLQLKQFSRAADAFRQTDELMPDLGRMIADNKSADFLLHGFSGNLQAQQTGNADETFLPDPVDTGVSPFVEELTPWWFDDQMLPGEEPEVDYDFWYINDAGVHSPNEKIVSTAPLTWEAERSREDVSENEQQDIDAISKDDTEVPDCQSVEGDTEQFEPASVPQLQEPDQSGQDDQDKSGESVMDPVVVITNRPEILTESPEFSSEDITSPDAVQYEFSIDWPTVELSQAERLEIQSEINKFKRVLEINPRNAFAWDSLGGSYKALGQYGEAIDAYRKAVNLDSSKAFYFHHLGLVYAVVGRYDEAIDAYERVIEVDPNHSLAHATLGGYYRKKGNEELAAEHIEKARTLLAKDENEYNRACMEAICGNTDQSLELLELALKNKQTYVNWACKDPDLDFIRSDPRFRALLAEYAVKTA